MTAAFVCKGLISLSYSSAWAAGKVLSSDGKLFTIRAVVVKGCSFEDCDWILYFTLPHMSCRTPVDVQ
jgi:hypothetical protein